jgi:hypothetical protein
MWQPKTGKGKLARAKFSATCAASAATDFHEAGRMRPARDFTRKTPFFFLEGLGLASKDFVSDMIDHVK